VAFTRPQRAALGFELIITIFFGFKGTAPALTAGYAGKFAVVAFFITVAVMGNTLLAGSMAAKVLFPAVINSGAIGTAKTVARTAARTVSATDNGADRTNDLTDIGIGINRRRRYERANNRDNFQHMI
jgi:hypothetical protein